MSRGEDVGPERQIGRRVREAGGPDVPGADEEKAVGQAGEEAGDGERAVLGGEDRGDGEEGGRVEGADGKVEEVRRPDRAQQVGAPEELLGEGDRDAGAEQMDGEERPARRGGGVARLRLGGGLRD